MIQEVLSLQVVKICWIIEFAFYRFSFFFFNFYLFIYFIYGCVGSSFLCEGFL